MDGTMASFLGSRGDIHLTAMLIACFMFKIHTVISLDTQNTTAEGWTQGDINSADQFIVNNSINGQESATECSLGTFSRDNGDCHPCNTHCPDFMYVSTPCTAHRDIQCSFCPNGTGSSDWNMNSTCLNKTSNSVFVSEDVIYLSVEEWDRIFKLVRNHYILSCGLLVFLVLLLVRISFFKFESPMFWDKLRSCLSRPEEMNINCDESAQGIRLDSAKSIEDFFARPVNQCDSDVDQAVHACFNSDDHVYDENIKDVPEGLMSRTVSVDVERIPQTELDEERHPFIFSDQTDTHPAVSSGDLSLSETQLKRLSSSFSLSSACSSKYSVKYTKVDTSPDKKHFPISETKHYAQASYEGHHRRENFMPSAESLNVCADTDLLTEEFETASAELNVYPDDNSNVQHYGLRTNDSIRMNDASSNSSDEIMSSRLFCSHLKKNSLMCLNTNVRTPILDEKLKDCHIIKPNSSLNSSKTSIICDVRLEKETDI